MASEDHQFTQGSDGKATPASLADRYPSGDKTELDALLLEVASTARHPFVVLNADMTVHHANPAFLTLFRVTERDTLGHSFFSLGNGQWDIPALRTLLGEVLPQRNEVDDYRVEHRFQDIGFRIMLINARRLIGWGRFPEKVLVAIEDVTEREKLQSELLARSEFTEKLVDSLREAVLVLTADLKVYSANRPFYELFKVNPEETIGQYVYDLGNGQWNISELRRLLGDILPQRKTFDDYELDHAFETIGWRLMSLNARRLDHLELILLTIRDLTETALNQKALDKSREWLHLALEASQMYAWRWDMRTGEIHQWQKGADSSGPWFPRHESEAWQAVHPDDVESLRATLDKAIAERRQFTADYRVIRPTDGRVTWVHSRGKTEIDESGVPVPMLGTTMDVTARKEAEEALQYLTARLEDEVAERTGLLQQERNLLDAILDSQPAPVLVVDLEGRIVRFNKACEAATGYDFEQLKGTNAWLDLVPDEERGSVQELLGALLSGQAPLWHENHWRHRDGFQRLFMWTNAVVRGAGGEVQYIIGSGVDISEQRKAEAEARRHLEEAARLQRLQTANELAGQLAHEMNQPLATLSILADASRELLTRSPLDRDKLGTNLVRMRGQALRAGEIIRRLRGFVSRGSIEPVPLDLNEVIKSACALFGPKMEDSGIRLVLNFCQGLPPAKGVDVHIEQVVLNLLRNAVESIHDAGTANGRISLETAREGSMARVTVYDNGPGVDAEKAGRLFEPLFSTKPYGLGVGLRISRSLIEAVGGRLWAEPHAPGGIFYFEVPLAS